MREHITIIYHEPAGHIQSIHIENATSQKLQQVFENPFIHTLKRIYIEQQDWTGLSFQNLYSEKDIAEFLKTNNIKH